MFRQPQAEAAVCGRRSKSPTLTDRRLSAGPCRLGALIALIGAITHLLPAAEFSEPAPLAVRSLLLDVTRAGSRLAAVGDRGHVLLSDDEGRTWRQIVVPTRAMLTGVSFGDATHGWAVGHDGVILATTDAGETWTRQDSGQDLETVWLDVFFSDARIGLAVGAYGRSLLTLDGGSNWQPAAAPPDELHLNHIAPTATDTIYVAGEAGTLLTSANARSGWRQLAVGYDGSLYGTLPLGDGRLLAFGLRGRVFSSDDAGATWSPRETAVSVPIMAGLRMKSGTVVLAGQGGSFHLSRDDGATFGHWQPPEYNGGVSALVETSDGALVVAGEKGVARLQLPLK
ncbi:MAG: WD40/YVTN/BNR-like repeat-containing protein [Verrucomicrobiota bacterium]